MSSSVLLNAQFTNYTNMDGYKRHTRVLVRIVLKAIDQRNLVTKFL